MRSNNCEKCCVTLVSTAEVISCYLCYSKFHIECVNVTKKNYAIIKTLDESAQWVCKECRSEKELNENWKDIVTDFLEHENMKTEEKKKKKPEP